MNARKESIVLEKVREHRPGFFTADPKPTALLETLAAADAKMPCIRLALNPLTDASEAYVKQSDALAAVAAAHLHQRQQVPAI